MSGKLKQRIVSFVSIVVTLLVVSPVFSDSYYAWGSPNLEKYPQSSVSLEESDQCVLQVKVNNQLSKNAPTDMSAYMIFDEIRVQVVIMQNPGQTPDRFVVIPQEGYFAEPEELTLNENTEGIFQICAEVGS